MIGEEAYHESWAELEPAPKPIHNHFNQDRYLNRCDIFKQNRAAALAEWRQLAA